MQYDDKCAISIAELFNITLPIETTYTQENELMIISSKPPSWKIIRDWPNKHIREFCFWYDNGTD